MTKKKVLWGGLVAALMGASFVMGAVWAKTPPAPKLPVLTKLGEAQWTPLMKDSPLPAISPIQGDAMKGAYLGYLKLPAGFTSPPHSHSSDYWAVVVQGKATHWLPSGSEKDAKQLTVGDLTFMPGKTEHISKCFPGVECIMVVMQKGKFDFVPGKTPPAASPTPSPTATPPQPRG